MFLSIFLFILVFLLKLLFFSFWRIIANSEQWKETDEAKRWNDSGDSARKAADVVHAVLLHRLYLRSRENSIIDPTFPSV
jgi:hypothetical protein